MWISSVPTALVEPQSFGENCRRNLDAAGSGLRSLAHPRLPNRSDQLRNSAGVLVRVITSRWRNVYVAAHRGARPLFRRNSIDPFRHKPHCVVASLGVSVAHLAALLTRSVSKVPLIADRRNSVGIGFACDPQLLPDLRVLRHFKQD